MAKKSSKFTTVTDKPDNSVTVIRKDSKHGKKFAKTRDEYGVVYDRQNKEMYPKPGDDPYSATARAASKKRVTEALGADKLTESIRDKERSKYAKGGKV